METSPAIPGSQFDPLTHREQNILSHLANERSSAEIARLETLSTSSVKWYIHQVYAKLGVNQRSAAIARARELGLLPRSADVTDHFQAEKHNLPRQLTSFIGRESEIATLLALVRSLPLVTLTGSGGTGKTRLALQVAERGLPGFADGVWWVNLAPLADPELVPLAIAAALGLRENSPEALIPVLNQFIGVKHLLLVLDNCEHLVSAAANLAGQLLVACPYLHILATSREVLGLPGERAMRCPPLSMPDLNTHPALAELTQSEAARLFVERAQNVAPDFRLSAGNAPLVAQLCQRLDGIPLAIELAAARAHLLSMEQITARLENVFHLLTGGGRAALPRHQTLKALVDWSYNLLSDLERRLLCRLSVFAGSWTLAAAEAVCAKETTLPATDILDLLGQLVDKSLVNVQIGVDVPEAEPRYSMLEMIRQYAHQRLLEWDEMEALREQHLDYYLRLGLQAEPHLRGNNQQQWKEKLETELDNLRLALDSALVGSVEKGLLLAAALGWFWHSTTHRLEGVKWLERLLAMEYDGRDGLSNDPGRIDTRRLARGKALNMLYWNKIKTGQSELHLLEEAVAIFQSFGNRYSKDLAYAQYLSGAMTFQESLALFREVGDPFYLTEALFHLAATLLRNGDLIQAKTYFEERQVLCDEREDLEGRGCGLWELGLLELLQGNTSQATEFFKTSQVLLQASNREFAAFVLRFQAWVALAQGAMEEAMRFSQAELRAAQECAISWVIVDALGFLGWVARVSGDEELALQHCEAALQLSSRVAPASLYIAHYVMGRAAIRQGDYARARTYLSEMVTHVDAFDSPHKAAIESPPTQLGLQVYGILAAAQAENSPAQAQRAARLFGAQAALADNLMHILPPVEQLEYLQALASVRAALSEPDFTAAWIAGQSLTLERAIAYALSEAV